MIKPLAKPDDDSQPRCCGCGANGDHAADDLTYRQSATTMDASYQIVVVTFFSSAVLVSFASVILIYLESAQHI
jgi:hypothetical protein